MGKLCRDQKLHIYCCSLVPHCVTGTKINTLISIVSFHSTFTFCSMNPRELLLVALPAWCVAVAVYFPTIGYEFTLDDEASVVKNPDVVDPHAPVLDVFFHDFWGRPLNAHNSHQSLRPLTTLSFRFDRWRAELDGKRYKTDELRLAPIGTEALQPGSNDAAYPFHVTNVLLHALASAMLSFFCFHRLGTSKREAILTGTFFAVHPVHVESVANITGRADILAFLFLLAYAQNFSLWWSTIFGFAATLNKETAVPLLVVDATVLLWTLPRKPRLVDVKYLFISTLKTGMSICKSIFCGSRRSSWIVILMEWMQF